MRVCCRRVYSACMTVGHHGYIMASRSRYPNTIESGATRSTIIPFKSRPLIALCTVRQARGGVGIRAFGCARSQRRCQIGPPTVGRKPYHKAPGGRFVRPRYLVGTRGVYKLQKS
jgi:hypothetical protein